MRFILICLMMITPFRIKAEKAFLDAVTLTICVELEDMGVRKVKGKFLNTIYVQRVVNDTWDAALLNPSLGTRKEATIKLLSAFYGESGFHPKVIYRNRNGSFDRGITQRNDINQSWYLQFCKDRHLNPKKQRSEILFAAFLNENLKTWAYTYDNPKRADQRQLYKALRGLL